MQSFFIHSGVIEDEPIQILQNTSHTRKPSVVRGTYHIRKP